MNACESLDVNKFKSVKLHVYKSRTVIQTQDGWNMPVKHNKQRQIKGKRHIGNGSTINSVIHNDGIQAQSKLDAPSKWIVIIGEMMYRKKMENTKNRQIILKSIKKIMTRTIPTRMDTHTVTKAQKRMQLQTWSTDMYTEKNSIHITYKQDQHESNKIMKHVLHMVFQKKTWTISNATELYVVDDYESVIKLRRKLKAMSRDMNIKSTVMGSEITYFMEGSQNLAPYILLSKINSQKYQHAGHLDWDSMLVDLGLTISHTDSEGTDAHSHTSDIQYDKEKSNKKKRRKKSDKSFKRSK